MEFFTRDDIPTGPGEETYRYGALGLVLVTFGMAVLGVVLMAIPVFGWLTGQKDWQAAIVLGVAGAGSLLFARVFASAFGAYVDPQANWLMRRTPNGLILKFRSLHNRHLPAEDPVAVRIAFGEIEWARKTRETVTLPSSDGPRREVRTHLDLKLRSDDAAALAAVLKLERARQAPWVKHWYGRSRGKANHYPVQLAPGDVVRVAWAARPGISKVLERLKGSVTVAPPLKVKGDFYALRELPAPEQEARVRDLAARGEVTAAVAAAELAWGLSTTEAVRRVHDLTGVNDLTPTTVAR